VARGWHPWLRTEFFEDFLNQGSSNFGLKLTTVLIAGTPTAARRANVASGVARLALEATNEAMSARADWGDQLMIPGNSRWLFQAGISIPTAIAAAQRVAIGVASAYNATLDSATYNAWFRLEANMNLLLEADDNVTDTSQAATRITALAAATFYRLTICAFDTSQIEFYVNSALVGTVPAGAFAAANLLQPFIIVQKDSGVGVPACDIDYARLDFDRSI
jgi:hypothetical protein